MSHIHTDIADDVGIITLCHQAKRNALSEKLIKEVQAALGAFKAQSVRVVILRAEPGAKVW